MIVGYMTSSGTAFCYGCWRMELRDDADQALDDEVDDGPDDNFWIVDICAVCGAEIYYMDAVLLG